MRLARTPLLRSTGMLAALFSEAVVVTESDSDRAFYQEINERLLQSNRGIKNCLFLNAQNKQTERHVFAPLRKLGIPSAAIVDLDIVSEGGTNWMEFLSAANVPEIDRTGLGNVRPLVKQALVAAAPDWKTRGGLDVLDGAPRESARNLCDHLARYGLFVVRRGALESWLRNRGVTGYGPAWVVSAFEMLKDDPQDPQYVRPSADDVWSFLDEIGAWVANPHRAGLRPG